jgi:hypothetical protein
MTMMRLPAKILVSCLISGISYSSSPTLGVELYKIVDSEGRVTYTDKKPGEEQVGSVTRMDVDPEANLIKNESGLPLEERERRLNNQIEQRQAQDEEKRAAYKEQLAIAEAAVREAEKSLEAGSVVRAGDFLGKKGGGARPSPQRLERLEKLNQDLQDAKQHLRKIRKNKP